MAWVCPSTSVHIEVPTKASYLVHYTISILRWCWIFHFQPSDLASLTRQAANKHELHWRETRHPVTRQLAEWPDLKDQ